MENLSCPKNIETPKLDLKTINEEIIATWRSMQGSGQCEAYRIMERMVRRLGYNDFRDPSLAKK